IATVWLINGLFCKVLNLVPRHEKIVARILDSDFSRPLTILIGLLEIAMAIWIFTKIKSRLNDIAQMTIIATMNIMEFILTADLLLWRMLNIVFAFIFVGPIYYNEFVLTHKLTRHTIE